MKWLILISIIMVGCILEPVPEEREPIVDVYISGYWIDVYYFQVFEIDAVFYGSGDTLKCDQLIENSNIQYGAIMYKDTIEMIVDDGYSIKMVNVD